MIRKKDRRPPSMMQSTVTKRALQPLLLAAVLVACTVLVYAQTCRFGFMLIDDPMQVSENPRVRAGFNLQNITWTFSSFYDCNWIPFTWLSLMLDTSVFGFRAGGYHFTNVLLHAANTVLLFAFFARATGYQLRSACVAALFALHPLHVESVAWITERKDVLSTLFGLLSLLAYVSYAKNQKIWSFAACFLCFIASLLSKQTLVTLPCVFLLLDYWPLGRLRIPERLAEDPAGERPSWLRLIVEKVPFFAVSAAFSVIAAMAQAHAGTVKDFEEFPFAERLGNATWVYAAYLGKTFWPRNLAVYYPYQHDALSWTAIGFAATLLPAITLAAIACLRRSPFFFVGWFWYLGTLVPMIGLVQIGPQQMADRYTYFPLIGIFVAVVWLACELVPAGVPRTRALPAVALTVVALLAATAYSQIGLWRDNVTLLRHSKDYTPDNYRAHQLLGQALLSEKALSEALAELETAARMGSRSASAHTAFGIGLQQAGRLDEAAEHYRASLAINEPDPEVHSNLGLVQLKRHEYEAAKQNFRRAIELDPDFVLAYVNLGTLSLQTGDYAESLAASQRAVALDPAAILGRHNLAIALVALGRLDEAIAEFQSLATVLPDDLETRANLARALAMKRASSGK